MEDGLKAVRAYHLRSKHHLDRYAPGPGFLDWANQPEPFRRWSGCPSVELDLEERVRPIGYRVMGKSSEMPPRPISRKSIGNVLRFALGLSAWKEFGGSRWALRCNPSSGNLHPTEGYLVTGTFPDLDAGVYHYESHDHVLERRLAADPDLAALFDETLGGRGWILGLTSVHWREAWKYGERAFRYCQHDLGHAVAAVRYAAALEGWSARLLVEVSDARVRALLGLDAGFEGLDPQDRESEGALVLVGHGFQLEEVRRRFMAAWTDLAVELAGGEWKGVPSALSRHHVRSPVIDEIAARTRREGGAVPEAIAGPRRPQLEEAGSLDAEGVILGRRSCLALDGVTTIPLDRFVRTLDALLPRPGVPPFDALSWSPLVHLAIFVHRVDDLDPGLYLLERAPEFLEELKAASGLRFSPVRPRRVPPHLPLRLLTRGDFRSRARTVSCHQEIASDGAFALGMIVPFERALREQGPGFYRHLFWESGVVGQALYLEVENQGFRGTGIGCYFDDEMHRILGLEDLTIQSLYHFTAGGPVEDRRLVTHPPYRHLDRRGPGPH